MWILSQMKRWGYIKGDVDYKAITEQVFLLTDAKKHMKELGQPVPAGVNKPITVMGKAFDPAKADAYANSFAIKRSSR